jgi:tellurite resistance-related uncharacterized protein
MILPAMRLPDDVRPYRCTPIFTEATMPAGLRADHSTKSGIWGLVTVIEGRLRLIFLDTGERHLLDPESPGIIAPERAHRAEPLGPVRFTIDFCAADQGDTSVRPP